MQGIKIIILGIIAPLINTLPLSYTSHILLLNALLNTDIFTKKEILSLLNISLILSTIYFFHSYLLEEVKRILKIRKENKQKNEALKKEQKNKKIKHKQKKITKNWIRPKIILPILLTTVISVLIPTKNFPLKIIALLFILTALILFLSTNKKGNKSYKELKVKDFILLSLSPILTIIPTISPLGSCLFLSSILHLNKKTALNLSLLLSIPSLLLASIPGVIYFLNDTTYLLPILISLTISTILSIQLLNYLKKIYFENKLYKLSLYLLLLSIFILIWFR